MINFDSLTLKAQLEEIAFILEGARIQKVQQPTRTELLFSIRSLGVSHKFYVSINPSYPHCSILSKEGEDLRYIKIPQMPPMFCMLLRKHMEGAKILEVRQPEHERIIEFYFDSYNELGERIPMVLSIELMGKHSNIVLYNYDTNVIIGCAHNVSSEKSRERELAGTLPYIYPPKQNKRNLLDVAKNDFISTAQIIDSSFSIWLNKNFADISLALANEICDYLGIENHKGIVSSVSMEKVSKAYDILLEILSLDVINPSISKDFSIYSLISLADADVIPCESVNDMVDIYFGKQVYKNKFEKQKSSLLSVINKEIKKANDKKNKLSSSENLQEKSEQNRVKADVIMANLYQMKIGDEKLIAINPYTNEDIQVDLDSTHTPNENAQKYYKLYNKAKNACLVNKKLIDELKEELKYCETILYSVNSANKIEELEDVREELVKYGLLKPEKIQQSKKAQKEKIKLEKIQIDGFDVFIGKNNKQNDYIISKLSSGNDIWLHAQEIPGSHVLIKIPPEDIKISDSTIYDAAKIAAANSQAKESSKVPVVYTRRKFIKKPPAAKPGYVIFKNEKTIIVDE